MQLQRALQKLLGKAGASAEPEPVHAPPLMDVRDEDVGALAVRLSGGIYGIYGDIFQGNFSSSRCCLFFPWLFSIKRSPRCILIDRVESTGLNVLGLDWADCSVTNATGGCCVGDSKSVEEDCDGVCAAVVKGGQEGDDAGTREEGK